MMLLRTITLVIVCLLLTTLSLKAEEISDSTLYPYYIKIKALDRDETYVYFKSSNNAEEKIGLNANKLNDNLRRKIRKNFANIKLEDSPQDKYKPEQIGSIIVSVWVAGVYSVAYHMKCEFFAEGYDFALWQMEELGAGTKDTVRVAVKKSFDEMIQAFVIKFLRVRGEL